MGQPPMEGPRAVQPQDITVAIFCALATEVAAVRFTLDERLTSHPMMAGLDAFTYSYGRIEDHNDVIARGTQMGPVNAAACAATAVQQFPNIRFALMIGIAGGIPSRSRDIRLGDVAVGIPGGSHPGVLQYDFGKYQQDGSFILKGCLNKPPSILINACHRLEEEEEEMGRRPHCFILKNIGEKHEPYQRPSKDDVLFKDDFHHVNASGDCSECEAAGEDGVISRRPRNGTDASFIHLGLILSGGGVVKNPEDRHLLRRGNEDAICFEMEAAGIVDQIPCLVIRGICDYADTHKNDDWHRYAAAAAAAYGKAVLANVTGQEVKATTKAQDLTKALEIGEHVDLLRRSNDQQKALDWLGQEGWRHPQDDHFAKCEPGTGRWLLDSPQFSEWLKRTETTLLCQGLPGAGKTVMASLVIDHLTCSTPEETVVVYAYCDAGKREQQKAVHILASLLRQLIEASPSMPESVQRFHSKNQGRQLSSVSARELTDVLIDATLPLSRVYVVIDALDESEEVSNLLPEIFRMQQEVNAKVFVTSRPDKRLEAMFDQYLSLEIRASDEDVSWYLEQRIAQHDVIKDELGEYAEEVKVNLREAVKEKIMEVSDGIFLLARFHMDYVLEMTSPNRMKESIEMLPRGLAAYREIYLKTTQRIESQPCEYCSLAKATLTWLVCVKSPMTVPELREALAIKINASSLDNGDFSTTKSIVEACKGLVSIGNDDVIQLLHHTAREYLDSNFGWLQGPSIRGLTIAEATERAKAMAHRDITLKLLTYISFAIFEAGPCGYYKQYLERRMSHRLYSYASCHWVDHLKSSGPYVSNIVDFGTNSLLARLLGNEKKWRSSIQAFLHGYSPSAISFLSFLNCPEGFTSLHLAAFCGVQPLVTALLGSYELDAQDEDGRTPLSHAAEKGHVDVVMSLLNAGADVDKCSLFNQTPLVYAVQKGHGEVVRCLLDKEADTERRNYGDRTPLALAVLGGHRAILDLLLERNADIEAKDFSGMTPLNLAARNGPAAAVEYLLQKNAKAETRDHLNQTPLLQVAKRGYIDVAQVLLDWGVDIEAKDYGDFTPLIRAASGGHIGLAKALLQNGCNVEARTVNGDTALICAVHSDHLKTESLSDWNDDWNDDSSTLLESDINHMGEVVTKDNFEMCQLLLDNGANPNGIGATGRSPLLEAERLGRVDIYRFLLRAGAEPNMGSSTAMVAPHDHVEVVRALAIASAETTCLEPPAWYLPQEELRDEIQLQPGDTPMPKGIRGGPETDL
ncbi:NACHT domain-containing protein [Fusarium sp. LHS14.1]|nr:NACHT domain-containing protein [Fusarium sp. LHS14.1]